MHPVFKPTVRRSYQHKGSPAEMLTENVATCSLWCSDEKDVQEYRTRLGKALHANGQTMRGRSKDDILAFIEDELHPGYFSLEGQDFLHNPYYGKVNKHHHSRPSIIEIHKRMERDAAIVWGYISHNCIQQNNLVLLVTLWIGKHEKEHYWCDFDHESVGNPIRQTYFSRNTNVPQAIFRAYLAHETDPRNANWERDSED